jgi:hypothetical protein
MAILTVVTSSAMGICWVCLRALPLGCSVRRWESTIGGLCCGSAGQTSLATTLARLPSDPAAGGGQMHNLFPNGPSSSGVVADVLC